MGPTITIGAANDGLEQGFTDITYGQATAHSVMLAFRMLLADPKIAVLVPVLNSN